jgi:hypothetical protein
LRVANDHGGSVSPLLRDATALAAALADLARARVSVDDKIVVEFCDTADEAGIYRKYAAFRVGDRIVPRHVFFSRSWQVQGWDLVDDARLGEELAYVERNPHAREVRAVFELAGIDYGRVDYGLTRDGRLQVWEINTNPTIVWPAVGARAREAVHAAFAVALAPAWRDVDDRRRRWSPAAWARARAPEAWVRIARRIARQRARH